MHEGRFSVLYPAMPGLAEGTCIDLHSKMMAVDDEWLRIGSANINNRSMGVDTECDVAIEAAGRADVAQAIRNFRNKLLAEHLGVTPEEVARQLDLTGTIRGAVEALRSSRRTLAPLEVEPYSDVTLSLAELADPEQAVGVDKLMAMFSFGAEFHQRATPGASSVAIRGSRRRSLLAVAVHYIAGNTGLAAHAIRRREVVAKVGYRLTFSRELQNCPNG